MGTAGIDGRLGLGKLHDHLTTLSPSCGNHECILVSMHPSPHTMLIQTVTKLFMAISSRIEGLQVKTKNLVVK